MANSTTASPEAPKMAVRLIKGAVSLGVSAIANTLGQLALVPVALKYWGTSRYGEWVALSSFIAFVTMSDLGLQTYVVNRLCIHHAREDWKSLCDDLHSALRLQIPLLLVLFGLGCLALILLPMGRLFGVETLSPRAVRVTAFLLGLDLVLSLPMAIIGGTYRATGLLERAGYIMALHRLAFWIVPIAFIVLGANLPAVALGRLLSDLLVWAWMIADLKRIHPQLRLWPTGGRFSAGLRMLPAGLLFFIASIADYLSNQGTLTLVQLQLGGTELAHFSTHRTVANVGRLASGLLMASAWPEFTRLGACSEVDKLRSWFKSLSRINGWLTGMIMIAFFPVAHWMYGTWTLRRLELDPLMTLVLFAQTILWGFWNVGSILLGATNRQGRLVWIFLSSAAVNLLLTMILVRYAGVRGAAISALVADLIITAWLVPLTALRALDLSLGAYLRQILATIFLALIGPCCAASLIWWCVENEAIRDVLVPTVGALLSSGVMYLLLSEKERLIVRETITKGRGLLERVSRSLNAGATSS